MTSKFDQKKIEEYLKFLGLKKKYKFKINNCEICGNKKNNIIRSRIHIGKNKNLFDIFCYFPFFLCNKCNLLFQKYKIEKKFYDDYYKIIYRKRKYKSQKPNKLQLQDIQKRGKYLLNFLKKNFNQKKGSILDVGCSLGGMLKPFKEKNWHCVGVDPDKKWVSFGKKYFNLDLKAIEAEKMNFNPKSFDIIIIIGSLEHVYDPNIVLKKCFKYLKHNGLIVLEGRGNPIGNSMMFLNHNHHRIYSLNTFRTFLFKHGFNHLYSTDKINLTGPVNKGGLKSDNTIFYIGKKKEIPSKDKFKKYIEKFRKDFKFFKKRFDEIDQKKPLKDAIILN